MNIPQSFIDTVDRLCDEQEAKGAKLGDTVYFEGQSTEKEPRRIVQISTMPETEHFRPITFALCNDGTSWMLPHYNGAPGEWHRLPDIPQ